MPWRRALVVWLVIIVAETVHGTLRQLFVTPLVGDLPARQIGIVVGALIVFGVAVVFSRWLGARRIREQLAVGLMWVVLTVVFEQTTMTTGGRPMPALPHSSKLRS